MYRPKIFALLGILLTVSCIAQNGNVITPDLTNLVKDKKITLFNRDVSILNDPHYKNGIHLIEKEGSGVAWFNNIRFGSGTIEFYVKGRNIMQKSFVGIAFHGLNDSTMEAVYFRPFNFQAQDAEKRNHSVQYISLPAYDWQKLRTDFPNKYEHTVSSAPQPNDWFLVRLVINGTNVSVYLNNNSIPDLVVDQLSNRQEGMIGFWVGNNSDGNFANLKITMK